MIPATDSQETLVLGPGATVVATMSDWPRRIKIGKYIYDLSSEERH